MDDEGIALPSIIVPDGKMAASFYWYERDTELYQGEITAMRKYFPQFTLKKLSDGRLAWGGSIRNAAIGGATWYLQVVYDHNHPNNSSYGGSIKVYSVKPDLDELTRRLGSICHTLTDSSGHIYICTARREDFRASYNHSTTAASAIAWAAKWISAYELWMAGKMTKDQFCGHSI